MLSSKNLGAAQAASYYEKDEGGIQENAGNQAESRYWCGKGAVALNLRGEVVPADFQQLVFGKDLQGRSLHAKPIDLKKHRAGTDFTFSAPKSVSIAALLQDDWRVTKAHDHAVRVALDVMELRYPQARIWNRSKRKQTRIQTGNLVAAAFRHRLSREQEPQLHTHVFTFNASQLSDGSWRALSNEEMVARQKLVGQIYQHQLAYNLRQLGYEPEINENGQFELKGYSQELRACFSTRRKQIEKYAAQFEQFEQKTAKLCEQAALHTRKGKRAVSYNALVQGWKRAVAEQGLALPALPLNEDRDLEASSREPAETAAIAGIEFAQAQSFDFERETVEQFGLENYLGRCSWEHLQTAIDQTNQLVPVAPSLNLYTTQTAIERKRKILRLVQQSQGEMEAITSLETVQSVSAEDLLTQNRREALEFAATCTDRFVIWQGIGKGESTRALPLFEKLAENQGYCVRKIAPDAVKMSAEKRDESAASGREIWIVSAAETLSTQDTCNLFEEAVEQRARVLLVGDTRQVPDGNPFKALTQMGISIAQLGVVSNQKAQTLQQANKNFAQKDLASSLKYLFQAGAIRDAKSQSDAIAQVIQEYANLPQSEREKTVILVDTSAERQAIVAGLRQQFQREGQLEIDRFTLMSLSQKNLTAPQAASASSYESGDVVVVEQTYKRQNLEKAQLYKVSAIDIEENQLTLELSDGKVTIAKPAKCEQKTVYQRHDIPVAVGDQLCWTRSDRLQGKRKGRTFTIEAVDEFGNAQVRYADGKTAQVNLGGMQFADYAIAVTTFRQSQKAVDRVLGLLNAKLLEESLHPAIACAKSSLILYSSDVEKLKALATQSNANPSVDPCMNLFTYQIEKLYGTQQTSDQIDRRDFQYSATASHSADRGQCIGERLASRLGTALSGDQGFEDASRSLERSASDLSSQLERFRRSPGIAGIDVEQIAHGIAETFEEQAIKRHGPDISDALEAIAGNLQQFEQSLGELERSYPDAPHPVTEPENSVELEASQQAAIAPLQSNQSRELTEADQLAILYEIAGTLTSERAQYIPPLREVRQAQRDLQAAKDSITPLNEIGKELLKELTEARKQAEERSAKGRRVNRFSSEEKRRKNLESQGQDFKQQWVSLHQERDLCESRVQSQQTQRNQERDRLCGIYESAADQIEERLGWCDRKLIDRGVAFVILVGSDLYQRERNLEALDFSPAVKQWRRDVADHPDCRASSYVQAAVNDARRELDKQKLAVPLVQQEQAQESRSKGWQQ